MTNIDLSRVKEKTLDIILKKDGSNINGKTIYEKILEYTRIHGTENATELYKNMDPPVKILKSNPPKKEYNVKRSEIINYDYENGTVEEWTDFGIANFRSESQLFSTAYSPIAFRTLLHTLDKYKEIENEKWELNNGHKFKIKSTCPKIPKIFDRIKEECKQIVEEDKGVVENYSKTWMAASSRIKVSRDQFKTWYNAVHDWLTSRGAEYEENYQETGLRKSILNYISKLENDQIDIQKNRTLLNVTKTSVSMINQLNKSNYKKEEIEEIQKRIRKNLDEGSLDLYNNIIKIKFERFLKDNNIDYDDIYDAVSRFEENFGIDALIPFIKFDRAELAGNESGIDYTPQYLIDLQIKPKAERVVYRETNGIKAEFSSDMTFESNFGIFLGLNELRDLHETVEDVFNFMDFKFNKKDEKQAEKFETKLFLKSYIQLMNTIENFREYDYFLVQNNQIRQLKEFLINANKTISHEIEQITK